MNTSYYIVITLLLVIITCLLVVLTKNKTFSKQNRKGLFLREGLFLDDERLPRNVTWVFYPPNIKWTIVRTPERFKKLVRKKVYTFYSFDHDLGRHITGYDLIKYLGETFLDHPPKTIPFVYMHTQSPIGRENMTKYWVNLCTHLEQLNKQEVTPVS